MKKTYFYKLFDPREPDVTRYIGKADKLSSRYISHIKDATKETSKHLPKSIWINSLLTAGVKPEIYEIDELEYTYASEWCDKETYYIAKYLFDGNPLCNWQCSASCQERSCWSGSEKYKRLKRRKNL